MLDKQHYLEYVLKELRRVNILILDFNRPFQASKELETLIKEIEDELKAQTYPEQR
jgi:hypothetical protein